MRGGKLSENIWKEAVLMRRMKKISVTVIYILLGFLCTVLILLAAPRFIGLESYTVVSGSMEPEIPVGSAVYVKKRAFEEISEGDVITFLTEHGNMRVTHRVTEVDEKKKTFATKGDANESNDPGIVGQSDVEGKVVMWIPKIGYAAAALRSPAGIMLLISSGIALLLMNYALGKEAGTDGKNKNTAGSDGAAA